MTEFTVLRAGRGEVTYLQPVNRSLITRQATVLMVQESGCKNVTLDEARRQIREPTLVAISYRHEGRPALYQSHRLWKEMDAASPDSEAVSRTFSQVLRRGTLVFILSARKNVPRP